MSLIIIKHPESDLSVPGLSPQAPAGIITPEGIARTQQFINSLSYPEVHFIYFGPNDRAKFLAHLLERRYENAEVTVDARLRPRDKGVTESEDWDAPGGIAALSAADVLQKYVQTVKGGESHQDVSARANDFIHELRQIHTPEQTVILITNNSVIRNILHVQKGLSLAEAFALEICPLQVFEIPHFI